MKSRPYILILEVVTILTVIAIFIWQWATLPALRPQIESGLNSSLEKIARQAAEGLDRYYNKRVTHGNRQLVRYLPNEKLNRRNLELFKTNFRLVSGDQKLSNAWLIVYPDNNKNGFSALEYKTPSRYRKETDFSGSWREGTDLARFLEGEMKALVQDTQTVQQWADAYWANALDSNLVFIFNKDFNQAALVGTPKFSEEDGSLLGVVFNQTDPWYLENVLIRNYFNVDFWQGRDEIERIERKFLQIGVLRGKGNQLIYNSVAYGKKQFEFVVALSSINSWLSGMKIGISFRASSVADVANSIYSRNFYLIMGLLLLLLVFLILLFLAARRLIRLSRLRTEFVANVSHEIKTPLASIRLATDTLKLKRAKSEEQQEQVLGIIDKEANRLDYLIRTLLDFSRLEAGKKKYRRERLRVQDWWEDVKTFGREKAGPYLKSAEAPDIQDHEVELDPRAIEQVLTILIDNAVKYSTDDKDIRLVLYLYPDYLRLEVRDKGIGISRDNQGIIFKKFIRIGNTDTHNVKGHGIGLSIARAIIRDHKGRIGVESKAGAGSTFYFTIPLIDKKD